MKSYCMKLSLLILATQPMMVPIVNRESFIHPSVQVLNLNNGIKPIVLSPVDFVGTVEKTEPVVVSPAFRLLDSILPFISSLNEDIKLAVRAAAKDFLNETTHAVAFVSSLNEDIKLAVRATAKAFLNEVSANLDVILPFISSLNEDVKLAVRATAKDFLNETTHAVAFISSLNEDVKLAVRATVKGFLNEVSANLDVILPFISSLNEDIKLAVRATAQDFLNETTHAVAFVSSLNEDAKLAVRATAQDFYDEVSAKLDLFNETYYAVAAKDFYDEMSAKFELFCEKIHAFIDECLSDAHITLAITFWMPLVMQSTMAAATLACFLLSIAAATLLGCKVLHQAVTQKVHIENDVTTTDNSGKIYDLLFAFDYYFEETNLFPFNPYSISVTISLSFSVDEGINLIVPPIAIELSASTRVANDSLAVNVPAKKVTPAGNNNKEMKKEKNDQFVGPAFVKYRDPRPQIDDDDDDDDDQSSIAPAVIMESIESTEPTARSTHRHPGYLLFDFFDRREPHNDFDDDDQEESTVVDPTDDFDSQMEDLLFSFSNLSFKDNTSKKVSASEMEELVNAFANL